MSTVLDRIAAAAADAELRLRKAIPRGPDHLLLVFDRCDGTRVAGQWYADPRHAAMVAMQTQTSTGDAVEVPVLGDTGILLQPDGADRRLPVLYRLVAAPGATLVAHRPERRAMVRQARGDGQSTYTKVVRPDHVASMVARAEPPVRAVAVPQTIAVDAAAGTMTSSALSGRTLQRLLDDPTVPDAAMEDVGRGVGRAVARVHAVSVPAHLPHHGAAAEIGVTRRWLERAAMFGLLDLTQPPVRDVLDRALPLLTQPPCAPTFLHRDLHDLQVLVDDQGGVGILDFDLAAVGEPALDLANLLVHLELHARHHAESLHRSLRCAQAVLDGYDPTPDVRRRVPAYALATRLRLCAVNAFRPPRAAMAKAMLTEPALVPLQDAEEAA